MPDVGATRAALWGRVYFLEHFGHVMHELIDVCGRAANTLPTERQ
jgi:hypothetical protein